MKEGFPKARRGQPERTSEGGREDHVLGLVKQYKVGVWEEAGA